MCPGCVAGGLSLSRQGAKWTLGLTSCGGPIKSVVCADLAVEALGILGDTAAVMRGAEILLLGLDISQADINSFKLITADAPGKDFRFSGGGIKKTIARRLPRPACGNKFCHNRTDPIRRFLVRKVRKIGKTVKFIMRQGLA